LIAGKVNPFIYHYRIEVRLDEKCARREKISRRALMLCLIQFSAVLGRKNWMHSNTANGAKCSAALYSIVATAQANGLNIEQYLTELFSQPAGTILLPFNT
jgi:hypothetical protein